MKAKHLIVQYVSLLIISYLQASACPPNVVFILADDLGWDDVSFHGSKQIPTPNLDALAYDGIILSNYYVQPICTPTRSALLTGRHPIHTGLQVGTIQGAEPYGLGLNETLLPQYLKTLGYATHMVGKWHLGFYADEYRPTRRGFDSHYGYLTGKEDYWDHTDQEGGAGKPWGLDFWRNEEVVRDAFGQYSTELFTQEAEAVIQKHNTSQGSICLHTAFLTSLIVRDRRIEGNASFRIRNKMIPANKSSSTPLFLYLAHQGVHSANNWKPLEAPWKYYKQFSHIKDHKRRVYAAMVSAVDDSVGHVTKALHARGMLNNTLIIFSTDNGGPANGFDKNVASNAPLRGMKHTLWEGGVRGTGFVWSPVLNNTGIIAKQMIQVIDWLPTILSAAGYNMSSLPHNLDGIDQWGELVNRSTHKTIRTEILHNIETDTNEYALRINDWKLIFSLKGGSAEYPGWYPTPQGAHENQSNTSFLSIDEDTQQMTIMCNEEEILETNSTVQNNAALRHVRERMREVAPDYMFRSDLEAILKSMDRNGPKGSALIVDCGPKPVNTTHCDVTKAPCLFNVKHDPCEYNNRAQELPSYVKQMYTRFLAYNATAVVPKNKRPDPLGYPKNHDGVWKPWVKLGELNQ